MITTNIKKQWDKESLQVLMFNNKDNLIKKKISLMNGLCKNISEGLTVKVKLSFFIYLFML